MEWVVGGRPKRKMWETLVRVMHAWKDVLCYGVDIWILMFMITTVVAAVCLFVSHMSICMCVWTHVWGSVFECDRDFQVVSYGILVVYPFVPVVVLFIGHICRWLAGQLIHMHTHTPIHTHKSTYSYMNEMFSLLFTSKTSGQFYLCC